MAKSPVSVENQRFGEYYRALRHALGPMTLRDFCSNHRLDHGHISKIERGVLPPPAALKKLSVLAKAIGVAEGTPEWQVFLDKAYAARNKLPPDLAQKDEIIRNLPLIYRTLRGDPLTEKEIQLLMKLIHLA